MEVNVGPPNRKHVRVVDIKIVIVSSRRICFTVGSINVHGRGIMQFLGDFIVTSCGIFPFEKAPRGMAVCVPLDIVNKILVVLLFIGREDFRCCKEAGITN